MSGLNHSRPLAADKFFVLDLDRCLLDTEKAQSFLELILRRDLGIDPSEMNVARTALERSGGSFDTAGYVMAFLDKKGQDGPAVWHLIKQRFIDESQAEDMLLPFARQFIYELRLHHIPYGIVTFGNEAWQSTKIAAAGLLDIPHLITHELEKGRLLASWQRTDGSFLVPAEVAGEALYAKELVFIDDKPVSFVGLPEGAKGIWAIAPGASWPQSAYDHVGNDVVVVYGMRGAIELLFSH